MEAMADSLLAESGAFKGADRVYAERGPHSQRWLEESLERLCVDAGLQLAVPAQTIRRALRQAVKLDCTEADSYIFALRSAGLTLAEMAAVMECAVSTVHRRVSALTGRLRDNFDPEIVRLLRCWPVYHKPSRRPLLAMDLELAREVIEEMDGCTSHIYPENLLRVVFEDEKGRVVHDWCYGYTIRQAKKYTAPTKRRGR